MKYCLCSDQHMQNSFTHLCRLDKITLIIFQLNICTVTSLHFKETIKTHP